MAKKRKKKSKKSGHMPLALLKSRLIKITRSIQAHPEN